MSKKEALLMSENKEERREAGELARCQIAHVPGKPPSPACAEPAWEIVDGLVLCERHALEAKLEGQIECWEEMLLHIELWSREASRRNRTHIVELFDLERARAKAARERAYKDLDVLRRSDRAVVALTSGWAELYRRVRGGSLPLPPRDARQLSGGLRRSERR